MPLPVDLRAFVDAELWTFAKTMPMWPHEYLVRDKVDGELFERLVVHIRAHGREGRFYARTIVYYEEAGLTYWTMGARWTRRPSSTGAATKTPTKAAWSPGRFRPDPGASRRLHDSQCVLGYVRVTRGDS